MTGAELKQLRHDIGEAIGKRLSVADMARICGLAPANGADTWRKWEDGAGPSGPVAALLSVYAYAISSYEIPESLSEIGRQTADRFIDHGFREMIREEIRQRLR